MVCRINTIFLVAIVLLACVPLQANSLEEDIQQHLENNWTFEAASVDGKQEIVGVYFSSLRSIRSKQDLVFLQKLKCLRHLALTERIESTEKFGELLRFCPNLTVLKLRCQIGGVSPGIFKLCKGSPSIERLAIEKLTFPEGHSSIAEFPGTALVELEVSGNLTNHVTQILKGCHIEKLRVDFKGKSGWPSIQDINAISNHRSLKSLSILSEQFSGWADVDLSQLGQLVRLESLMLQNLKIDPAELQALPKLKYLTLRNCVLKDESFEYLLGLRHLKHLVIWECSNSNLGIDEDIKFPQCSLENLSLVHLAPDDLSVYRALPVNVSVEMGFCPVYLDEREVPPLLSTKQFRLKKIGALEVEQLEEIHGLKSVTIGGVSIRGSVLNRLLRMNQLESLRLLGVTIKQGVWSSEALPFAHNLKRLEIEDPKSLSIIHPHLWTDRNLEQIRVSGLKGIATTSKLVVDTEGPSRVKHARFLASSFPAEHNGLLFSLLSESTLSLFLDKSVLNPESFKQLSAKCPSLRSLVLNDCRQVSAKELLILNELKQLRQVVLLASGVTAREALALKTERVFFGNMPYSVYERINKGNFFPEVSNNSKNP